jgi:hypothetical protein
MHYFIGAIIAIIFSSVIFLISKKKARQIEKEMDPNDFIIRQPKTSLKLYIFVGIFFLIIFALGFLPFDYKDIHKWLGVLSFLPFLALGPFFIILWHRWKITVKGNQITACSYFGKEKSFTFDYITTIKSGVNFTKMGKIDYIIAYHEKKKLFSLSAICPGYEVLFSRLKDGGHSFV